MSKGVNSHRPSQKSTPTIGAEATSRVTHRRQVRKGHRSQIALMSFLPDRPTRRKPSVLALGYLTVSLLLLGGVPSILFGATWVGVTDTPCFGGSFSAGHGDVVPFEHFWVEVDDETIEVCQRGVGACWWSWSWSRPTTGKLKKRRNIRLVNVSHKTPAMSEAQVSLTTPYRQNHPPERPRRQRCDDRRGKDPGVYVCEGDPVPQYRS